MNDFFEGSLLGLAIGDALGFPTEFRRRKDIVASFPPEGVTDFVALHDPRWPARPLIMGRAHPPGTYSDDTQMTLAVAEAILDCDPDADLDALMSAMGRRFVEWMGADDNNRAPGNACMTGSQNLARGVPWRTAGVPDSKGCARSTGLRPFLLRGGSRSKTHPPCAGSRPASGSVHKFSADPRRPT